MHNEYECSFKTNDIKKYINYCENNNYEKVLFTNQIRKLYKNGTKYMARITINDNNTIFDFKEDKLEEDKLFKNRKESEELIVTPDLESFVYSILDTLEYKLVKELKRIRYINKKDNIKFEIDEYLFPKKENVIAIEGDKLLVDEVYQIIKDL